MATLPFTDRTSVSFTGASQTSNYHAWASGMGPGAGLLIWLHGDGAYEHSNPTNTYCFGGSNGVVALAKARGYIVISARTPDNTGDITWWESGQTRSNYLQALITSLVSGYESDPAKTVLAGFSGGAQQITQFYMDYQRDNAQGAGTCVFGGGEAPDNDRTYSTGLKNSWKMGWIVGALDTAANAEDGFDGRGAAEFGEAWFRGKGFTTSINVLPGKYHDLPGEFGTYLAGWMDANGLGGSPPVAQNSLMPSGGVQTFTGTDGTQWIKPGTVDFVDGIDQDVGWGYYNNNQGRMQSGTTAGYRFSARLDIAARADIELLFDWVIPSGGEASGYPRVLLRGGSELDTITSYFLTLERTQMEDGRYNASYSGTTITTKSYSGRNAGDIVRTRIAIFGNKIKARSWPSSNTEDVSTWDIDITDSTVSAAGYFGITMAGSTSGTKYFSIDNFNAFDSETPSQKTTTQSGSTTPSGILIKTVPKRPGGSLTSSGVLSIRRVVLRTFSGSVSVGGALNGKSGQKNMGGSVAPVGTLRKVARKRVGGSIGISATIDRRLWKRLFGQIATTTHRELENKGRVSGKPGIVIMWINKAGESRARVRKG